MIQGVRSVAAWLVHMLPWMYEDSLRTFWQYLRDPCGPHCVVSGKHNSQMSCKISDFRHPLCTGNGMMCCKERHTLLIYWMLYNLHWIYQGGERSFWQHLRVWYVRHCVISAKNNSNSSCKMSDFRYPISSLQEKWNDVLLGETSMIAAWVLHHLPWIYEDAAVMPTYCRHLTISFCCALY